MSPEGASEPEIVAFNKNQQQIITAFARGKLKPSPAWETCTAQHLSSINISLLFHLCNPFGAQQLCSSLLAVCSLSWEEIFRPWITELCGSVGPYWPGEVKKGLV